MYPEVSYPSRPLYSVYIGREAQYNTTNNYTQSILTIINTNFSVIFGLSFRDTLSFEICNAIQEHDAFVHFLQLQYLIQPIHAFWSKKK
jgi:hypothetical protein